MIQFGEIIECRVLRDKNSKFSKGVAFVQFNVKAQATSGKSWLSAMVGVGRQGVLTLLFAQR